MSLDVVTMQTALTSWLMSSTGLTAGTVYMADSGYSPEALQSAPYATLQLSGITKAGLGDEVAYIDHTLDLPAPALGQEIEARVLSYGVLTVNVQFFTPKAIGPNSALVLAEMAQTALALPSVHALLSNAGMSLADSGRPQNSSTVLDNSWRGRALLSPTFNVATTVSERLGYIAEVDGTYSFDPTKPAVPFQVKSN